MQDEGGAKKVNPVLERHWEKLVLGVVAALAVVYLGTRFSGPGDAAAKSVDRAASSFQAKKNQSNPKSDAPKSIPDHVIPPPGAANRAPATTAGNPTEYVADITRGPGPTPTKFVFPKVTLAPAVPKPDGVELSWTLGEVTIDPADKNKPVAVPRASFIWKVERRKKGGEWEVKEPELKSDLLKYQDTKTEPKTEYEYRLTLGSTDTQYTRTNPSKWLKEPVGPPVSASTPGVWLFDFSNMLADPDAEPPKPGQAYVTILKFDSDAGWVEWKKIQHEGDLLGVIMEGGVEVSKHRVSSKKLGKTVSVDFKSGARIKKITTGKLVLYDYEECRPKRDEGGELQCEGPKPVKGASYKVDELLYTDEDGKPVTFTKNAGPGPVTPFRCEKHGGAPPPKELTAEEKAAAKAKDAEVLLEEADVLWNKGTPEDQKKAIPKYKTLIERFKDVEIVKSRLKELTERSKKKFE